jgi:hypothetical protein
VLVLAACTTSVQVSPEESLTVIVVSVEPFAAPSDGTIATSSAPAGGVKAAVVTVVAVVVDTAAGPLASSVIVPFGKISTAAMSGLALDVVEPTRVLPGVPVGDVVTNDP